MCGIVGAFSFRDSGFRVTEHYLTPMRDAMAHRGPDGWGNWISPDECVGLGHRRLSIIDLSNDAAQPMSNEDGSLWVVFNGEIHNHAAIRPSWNNSEAIAGKRITRIRKLSSMPSSNGASIARRNSRHVRHRTLGCPRPPIVFDPRPHRHQASLLHCSVHHGRLAFASDSPSENKAALVPAPDQMRPKNIGRLVRPGPPPPGKWSGRARPSDRAVARSDDYGPYWIPPHGRTASKT
jgi:hypothetical protein